MTSVLFNISVTNDDIYEGNETFNLVVNVSSLSANVTVGDVSQAMVTIMNDDGKQCKTVTILIPVSINHICKYCNVHKYVCTYISMYIRR